MRSWLQTCSSLTVLFFLFSACGDIEPGELDSDGWSLTYAQVASVTASAHDGNRPENAVDGRMDTRWSASGAGNWIEARLASAATLEALEIAWYRGNERSNDFSIEVQSPGSSSFREVFRGRSSGRTADFERFSFAPTQAERVRVVFHGNTRDRWASISEMRLVVADGSSGGGGSGGVAPVRDTTASAHDGNLPANAVDGNLGTRWSCSGSCYLQLDLGQAAQISGARIAWYRGDERTTAFRILVSTDGSSFTEVFSGTSSGRTRDFETYTFAPQTARFVRIAANGNSDNPWNSISEIQILLAAGEDPGSGGAGGSGGTGGTGGTGGQGGSGGSGGDAGPIKIVAVTASGHDGNVPENVLDPNPATRWSCSGSCYLQLDLGRIRTFEGVAIAWYRGNERTTAFEVSVSDDAQSFRRVFQGTSSGTTDALVAYLFDQPESGRYVRISSNGNSKNPWNSITRVVVIPVGGAGDIPEDPGSPSDPGNPNDPGTGDPGTPGTPAGVDRFGVAMIYPTKPGGEEWYLAADPTRDPRFDPQNSITRNSDGSWKMKSNKVRMNVFTSTGYDPNKIRTYDRDVLAQQGYMQAPNDWRNVEITGYVKVNRASDRSDNFAWYARGGRHNDSRPCEGSAMKPSFHYDGRVRVQKETYHVSYEQAPYKSVTSSLIGRWIGLKGVVRNITVNGKLAVKTELYIDEKVDGKSWKLVYEHIDDGRMGGDADECGASDPAMPITWGGPIAAFRWDNADDVDFKWLSVREIVP